MKSISKTSYKIHSHFNLTDKRQFEKISNDEKEDILVELIRFFETYLLQKKNWTDGEIELYMLIDDEKVITVDDETGKERDEIEKLIHTLNTLTSFVEDLREEND
jgi:hypothetical protein|tara:strand:- start:568 stop:882 length:315 start_codon:yes stop_codon:yes gene_type:complete